MTRLFQLPAVAVFCLFLLVPVFAEAQPMGRGNTEEGRPPMGRGGGGASPVMMNCRDDLNALCDGKMGMPGVQCLMDNITDLSEPCADALSEAMDRMEEGHGQDGDDG